MMTYMIRRVIQAIIVVLGVMLIVVVLAKSIIGPRASPEQVHAVIQEFGFNQPIWVQYWREIYNYVHLDFGTSYQFNAPVLSLIKNDLPKTLLLVGSATILALIVAIPLGVFQVVRRNKPSDYAVTSLAFIFYAMPPFVLGP